MGRIAIVGATGFTGRLIAVELARAGATLLLAGRSRAKLEELAATIGGAEVREADVREPHTLASLARRGDVIVNCAGPFTELGEPVVAAAVTAGAHYLDVTGEQHFMARVHERWNEGARAAGVCVVNAMAFEYALGCCAATVLAGGLEAPLRALDVTYVFQVGAGAASAGTRRSILHILAAPNLTYEGGRWIEGRTGAVRTTIEMPDGRAATAIGFPAGEVLSLPRHLDVARVRGWAVIGRRRTRLLRIVRPLLPTLVRLVRPLAERAIDRHPGGPTDAVRHASEFLIVVDGEGADGSRGRAVVRGRDPYGLTAVITARGARRALGEVGSDGREAAGGQPPPSGVIGPAQLVEPRAFLEGLRESGVQWEVDVEGVRVA